MEFKTEIISLVIFIYTLILLLFHFLNLSMMHFALMILAVIFTAGIAMIVDRYLLDKIRKSYVNVMIVTFALALLAQSIVQIIFYPSNGEKFVQFGPTDYSLPAFIPLSQNIVIFEASIPSIKVLALIFSIVIMVLLYLFIWHTKIGLALRAVAQDENAAALVGINIRKVTIIVSGIGMGLVGFASVLTSPYAASPLWNPFMGWSVLISVIAIVTLGGLGSLTGSVISAFIISYTETIISATNSGFAVAVPLIVIILVIIIRPEGLFGIEKEVE